MRGARRARPREGEGDAGRDWKSPGGPVVHSVADAVFRVDLQQRIVTWSQGAEELLGYAADEAVGRPCYEVVQGCDDSGLRTCTPSCPVLRQATLGRVPRTRLMRLPTGWGEELFAMVTHLLLDGQDGQGGILHVINNVTEDARASQFLKELRSAMNVDLGHARRETLSAVLLGSLPLTRREREVLFLLMRGGTPQEIADTLVLTSTTVNNHLQAILGKLGCHTRREAVCIAFRECLSRPL